MLVPGHRGIFAPSTQEGTPGTDVLSAVTIDVNGSVVFAGYTEENDTQSSNFVAFKLDSGGKELWSWQVTATLCQFAQY